MCESIYCELCCDFVCEGGSYGLMVNDIVLFVVDVFVVRFVCEGVFYV